MKLPSRFVSPRQGPGLLWALGNPTSQGWPDIPPAFGQRWWNARVVPYHATYEQIYGNYLSNGYAQAIDPTILSTASEAWTNVDPVLGHAPLTIDTPWTLVDQAGNAIPFHGPFVDTGTPDDVGKASAFACGFIIYVYMLTDLGRMVSRISRLGQQ